MFFRLILWGFIIVTVFRFISRFLLPILQITRAAQNKMREMQEQMNTMQQEQKNKKTSNEKSIEGDYIDYEEIK